MSSSRDAPVVGIDASRMQAAQRTGTENYSHRIINELLKVDVDWRWRLYVNPSHHADPTSVRTGVDVRSLAAYRLWTHYRLSREMMTDRPNLLFVPAHVVPVIHPPSVVTIHDLGYLHIPDAHPPGQRKMLDISTRWSARVARHIIVPSHQTRDDLIRFYNVEQDKISVVHHGVDQRFRTVDPTVETSLRGRYGLGRPYVLAVGTIQPRKNLPVLARAIAAAADGLDLVIAGKRGWMADDVLREIDSAGLGARLRVLDFVPDDDLPALYASAAIFVQPSRFEGFGLPVLEAMATGTAVICASGSALDEVAGQGAEFFPPDDHLQLARSIDMIVADADRRLALQSWGRDWSASFTWQRAARETRTILQEALNEKVLPR